MALALAVYRLMFGCVDSAVDYIIVHRSFHIAHTKTQEQLAVVIVGGSINAEVNLFRFMNILWLSSLCASYVAVQLAANMCVVHSTHIVNELAASFVGMGIQEATSAANIY